ncbi:MAG: outer membrane lipoprotein-sorting protein [Bacteroidota bacterium]
MQTKIYTLILLLIGLNVAPLVAQDPVEILRKSEEVRRGTESAQAEMTMTIVRPSWKRSMSLKTWSKGEENALILVTAPARDKGMSTLKIERDVWNYMPSIGRTVKLSRSMMSQSWMGSDFTNNDLVQEVSVIYDYDHKILGEKEIEGRKCWIMELVPHADVAVVWGKVVIHIDQEDYLQMRSEFYDEDGYLVNVMQASDIKQMGGHTVATRLEMIPVEEDGHKTVMEYQSLKFDADIDPTFFSVQNMKRVR